MLTRFFRPFSVLDIDDAGGAVTLDEGVTPEQDAPAEDDAAVADIDTSGESAETDESTEATLESAGLTEEQIFALVEQDPDKFVALISPKKALGRFSEMTTRAKTAEQKLEQYERLLQTPAVREAALRAMGQEPTADTKTTPESQDDELLPDLTEEEAELMTAAEIRLHKATQAMQRKSVAESESAKQNHATKLLADHNDAVKAITAESKVTLTSEEAAELEDRTAAIYFGYTLRNKSMSVVDATKMAFATMQPDLQAKAAKVKSAAELAREVAARQTKQTAAGGRVSGSGGAKSEPADQTHLSGREITMLAVERAGFE